ncbi:MAG: type IV pili methyl-accepting chemotaxis transducer N-terminal domain-containing protein, partial [Pseudomonadota bacterium]
ASYTSDLGAGGFGSTLLIDLYGRQRMLSQKLSKEVCLVARGFEPNATPAELAKTYELFETSLAAFIEGMPIAGVPKPPSTEIADQLTKANTEWQAVRPTAALVVSGGAASLSDLAVFAEGMDKFLVEMNKAVKLLAAHQASS